MMPLRRLRAFTLVELLVVIGIIAVLISILLPTLAKARESANRAVCLSNMRQVHMAFMFYAQQYHDHIPIGYLGMKQINYVIWQEKPGRNNFLTFGLLFPAKLMGDGRTFYCPSEHSDQFWTYNAPNNPWPPAKFTTLSTRTNYGCRPVVAWPPLETDPYTPIPMPKLTKLKNQAIFADLFITPDFVTIRHKKGINVLYGHGGTSWVDRKVFDQDLKACLGFGVVYDTQQQRIWEALDRQ